MDSNETSYLMRCHSLSSLCALIACLALIIGCGDDSNTDPGPVAGGGTGGTGVGGTAGNGGTGGTGGTGASGAMGGTGGWTAPIGIPEPEFGIHESADETCSSCNVVTATDASALEDIPAGTVVELDASLCSGGTVLISGTGTASEPIFVRGPSIETPAVICQETQIVGSYIVVENIDFDWQGASSGGVRIEGDHIALRFSAAHDYQPGHNSTVIYAESSQHIVLWANHVHDNGDFGLDCAQEQDVHGVGGTDVQDIWIVDNLMHASRGDSMQFGHQADNTLSGFYIGRNDLSSDGENCVDIKEASNVVVSENQLHATHCGAPAVVFHDCPLNAAAIYNEIYDNPTGVSMASLETACDAHQPVSLFVISNDFHDLDTGIEAWGSGKHYYIAGNTYQNVTTEAELSNADLLDEDLQTAFDAFQAVYGIDISQGQ